MSGFESIGLGAITNPIAMAAYGNIAMGKAQQKSHEYTAQQLDQAAAVENQQGNAREEAQRRQASQILGTQRAMTAQGGTGMGGSAADVMQQSAINAELDSLMIRYESNIKSKGMKEAAVGERYAGAVAKTSGNYGAVSSILSGAGMAYGLA